MAEPVQVEKCDCPVPLKPMSEWIKAEKQEGCRPCVLAPVTQWYWNELNDRGHRSLAKRLEEKADKLDEDDPETVHHLCEELDRIKEEAPAELRERLKDFDCEVQCLDLAALEQETQAPESGQEAPPGDSPSSSQPQSHNQDIASADR